MDYERIHKPFSAQAGGSGFSPKKLRSMLLGVEKKRKEEEELEVKSSLRSEIADLDERRSSAADSCKDVECSTSTEMSKGVGGQISRDYTVGGAKGRTQEEVSFDSESFSSGFEFQKADRAPPHRSAAAAVAATVYVPPFSKPLPSKWDDAQKWIASPTSNRGGSKAVGAGQVKRGSMAGYGGGRMGPAKVVLEVEEADTKRVDGIQAKKTLNWAPDPYAALDPAAKPALVAANPVSDTAVNTGRHDSSAVHSTTTFIIPAPTVKSVSMRDMGTEMTPIASQEPSRTGTPVRATSPLQSAGSSRASTPQRTAPDLTRTESVDCNEDTNKEMSDKELQRKTRREIMVLGQQLGKTNIAAWASKEEAETNASISLRTAADDQPPMNIVDARAAAWEEAEKAKYLARFKREEIKIQAWENHQRAKTEAEMKKIEVEVERMRARAHEKLMNQLAAARHKAEEKRSAAEDQRNKQAAKTAEQADYIRRTGHRKSTLCKIPRGFSFLWTNKVLLS